MKNKKNINRSVYKEHNASNPLNALPYLFISVVIVLVKLYLF